MKYHIIIITLLALSSFTYASKVLNKDNVQSSMKSYVNIQIKANGFLPVIHKGKLLKLTVLKSKKFPDGFHSGVKNKGKLYTSCADFKDLKGNSYDIDFLVNKADNQYIVVQPIVHSINSEKNPYDLKH